MGALNKRLSFSDPASAPVKREERLQVSFSLSKAIPRALEKSMLLINCSYQRVSVTGENTQMPLPARGFGRGMGGTHEGYRQILSKIPGKQQHNKHEGVHLWRWPADLALNSVTSGGLLASSRAPIPI